MSAISAIANPVTVYMRIIRHDESDNLSLEEAYNELTDLINIRLQNQNAEDVSNGLLEKIFNLRIDIMSWLIDNFDTKNNFINTINDKISDINYKTSHVELFNLTKKILETTKKITSDAFEKETNNFELILSNNQSNPPNYNAFIFLQSHPNPQTRYFPKWLNESLKLDIGLTIADMVFDEKINLDQKRIQQELIPFLNKTIDRFGAYSIFTEFWKPNKDDHSPETYKMQILADTIRMNNGIQPLILENEEDLEDVALGLAMEAVSADKECVDVDEFLKELRG